MFLSQLREGRRPLCAALVLLSSALFGSPSALSADGAAASSVPSSDSGAESADNPSEELTFLDSLTVAATGSERSVGETPGKIDVVRSEEIEERGYMGLADLVRFSPGVYVEGDLTRLGSSGFNIRGIGGNRVTTQIDGVPTVEQFDFGPFTVTRHSVDVEVLERVEIVRSAGSALYGSDALGGVVSLTTRSPRSYLAGEPQHLGLRLGYDGRSAETAETVVYARGDDLWQGSLFYGRRDGSELDNQGTVASEDFTRTAPNPIDRSQNDVLLKLGRSGLGSHRGSQLEAALEWFDSDTETDVLSGRTPASPFASAVQDFQAVDVQERRRISLEQSLVAPGSWADSLFWRAFARQSETSQETFEVREGSLGVSDREGLLTFEQDTLGFQVEARKTFGMDDGQVLTYGLAGTRDDFDQLRDRREFLVESGAPVPTSLIFPTKYFPAGEVQELGVFVQAELDLWDGRLRLVPGLRFDSYALDADGDDAVFLSGNPGTGEPADLDDSSVSPKLGAVLSLSDRLSVFAQYAAGFRAPPMSAVNNGFTNQAGGYRTLANPDLRAETSDNLELGLRGSFQWGSFSVVVFENRYEDFIETVFLGFNPSNVLVEFQPQNLQAVEISGVELALDRRFGNAWRWRLAYSTTDGEDKTAGEPLDSIAPAQLVTGLRFAPTQSPWGGELIATATTGKSAADVAPGSDAFLTPSYTVVDAAFWWRIGDRVTLQASLWNLTDETYWQWTYARGRGADSQVLDRYTSPGRSFGLQARLTF